MAHLGKTLSYLKASTKQLLSEESFSSGVRHHFLPCIYTSKECLSGTGNLNFFFWMSFYCCKYRFKSYCIRRHLYFAVVYSSPGINRCPDPGFANVGVSSLLQQAWRHLQADIPQVPSEVLLRDKGNSDSLGRIFPLLVLFMKSSVRYFHTVFSC